MVRQHHFREVDALAPPGAVLATASSSIPCSRIADVTHRPRKVVNIHLYQGRENQPPEIMAGPATDPEACQIVYRLNQDPQQILTQWAPAIWENVPVGKHSYIVALYRGEKRIESPFALSQGFFEVADEAAAPAAGPGPGGAPAGGAAPASSAAPAAPAG